MNERLTVSISGTVKYNIPSFLSHRYSNIRRIHVDKTRLVVMLQSLLPLFGVILLLRSALSDESCPATECTLYMAPSTLPNAGLGVFTAIPRSVNSTIPSDLCIPFTNIDEYDEFNVFKDYYWAGRSMGMQDQDEALCYGMDCLVNCHLPLINVAKAQPTYMDRQDGDTTSYRAGTAQVTRPIPAGGELFKFYGDSWFVTRQRHFGKIPLSYDYERALKLLEKFETLGQDSAYEVVLELQTLWDSRTLNALPATLEEVQQALETHDIGVLHQPAATRDLQWLQQHGRCMDSLETREDGAFSKRHLQAGEVVASSPVHLVYDETMLHRYQKTKVTGPFWAIGENAPSYPSDWADVESDTGWLRHLDNQTGHELVLNYCFGQQHSSVLLCPYGAGVNSINHHHSEPNVRVDWDHSFVGGHEDEWLTMSYHQLEDQRPRLALSYIALRDIQPGEEILLDYGSEWEKAWSSYLSSYQQDTHYESAHSWNQQHATDSIRTQQEQDKEPYPYNLQLRCHSEILHHLPHKQGLNHTDLVWDTRDQGFPCQILDRFEEEGKVWYTVRLEVLQEDFERERKLTDEQRMLHEDKETKVAWIDRTDVPRSGLSFIDLPGTMPVHRSDAFRHPIGMPDAVFPMSWRNLG